MTKELLLLPLAYLLGSIPSGLLLAKAFGGVDIRNTGSGNIGATNVYRTMGRKMGIATLIADCLKGLIPVLLAKHLGFPDLWIAAVGAAAFIGHVYTVFLGFKGGKGVATALGVFLGTSPLAVLLAVGVFAFVLWQWRYVSLASICAAIAMPLLVALMDGNTLMIAMTALIASLVVQKHRENIVRLKLGTENRFKA
ncbi:glycerol-3-phosphate 1-O-acyltransferase PlsY [Geobacter sp. DSM 9736]|uniref:glycerol-3-phosphate 1-O-acyltransferase PlsY n=1 Tax=Geobacter sp. DSM 9736 TaxID=1277350 RepID=UPI000B506565|nr:glycerol-3-phosphate 1-O-acyltransferase PlsY [Geobacter sp. DSM 9736]SNB48026.1 acyl-phosphate glycerol-3-phosphate acyltransferase [Geobacter sp. DSM 9736]